MSDKHDTAVLGSDATGWRVECDCGDASGPIHTRHTAVQVARAHRSSGEAMPK